MNLLLAILLVTAAWTAWTASQLVQSYRSARRTGLPILISPTAALNPFWMIAYRLFPPLIPILQSLPFGLGKWARYTYMGWQFDDKGAIHDELGPAWVLVTPSINEVHVADPAAAEDILASRKSFIKPAVMYDALNAFGLNVNSAEGETWQHHRKITAPNFNERVSSSVWTEAVRQTEEVLDAWASKLDGTRDTADDASTLTLHVFTYAGFGLQYAFKSTGDKATAPKNPHKISYRDALHLVVANFTLLAILPMSALKWQIWPEHMQNVGRACDEYKLYLKEMVEREKSAVATAGSSKPHEAGNLLTALVQANQAEKHGLSDDELYGNLFMFNFAGHDTTALAVSTSIAYLAADPKWQGWLHEEICAVAGSSPAPPETWQYEELFPHLTRCRAVMYETLRLHGPVAFIPKAAAAPSQTITISGVTHQIPAGYFVNTNVQALHCDARSWGDDALQWRPDRWIAKSPSPQSADGGAGSEELLEPPPGTFAPWAKGPRACPGKKFAQVEFVAVMAVLFRAHTVAPKPERGESGEDAVGRVNGMIADSGITAMNVQMKRPRDVALVWKTR